MEHCNVSDNGGLNSLESFTESHKETWLFSQTRDYSQLFLWPRHAYRAYRAHEKEAWARLPAHSAQRMTSHSTGCQERERGCRVVSQMAKHCQYSLLSKPAS